MADDQQTASDKASPPPAEPESPSPPPEKEPAADASWLRFVSLRLRRRR
jgi:hypothetical protein